MGGRRRPRAEEFGWLASQVRSWLALGSLRAGTMHAMKGLEFQAVAVIGTDQVPEAAAVTPEAEDPVGHAQDMQRERCTLFVACTRARDHLYVSGAGEASPFLPAPVT